MRFSNVVLGVLFMAEAVTALSLHLDDDEVHALQEPYTPHGTVLVLAARDSMTAKQPGPEPRRQGPAPP